MTLKFSSYLLPSFSRVPFTIVLISGISTMVNGTLLKFGKRYEDNLRVIFDQWPKLHLGLDALSNQKIVLYLMQMQYTFFGDVRFDPIGNYLSNLNIDCAAKDNHKKYFIFRISFWISIPSDFNYIFLRFSMEPYRLM